MHAHTHTHIIDLYNRHYVYVSAGWQFECGGVGIQPPRLTMDGLDQSYTSFEPRSGSMLLPMNSGSIL